MSVNLGHPKPTTLEDIARAAGVNRRTVRDALQGTGRVAVSTRETVLRLSQELQYVPNASARALARGRTGRVVILSGSLNIHYNANAVHLLDNHLSQNGFETMLVQSHPGSQKSVGLAKSSLSDGVVAIGIQQLSLGLQSGETIPPWVLIDTSSPSFIDHITLDLRPASEQALSLMMAAGKKRIAYVDTDRWGEAPPEVRRDTYLEVMDRAGLPIEIIDLRTDSTPAQRLELLHKYLKSHRCPEAFFCKNDESAILVYHALTECGVRVPEDALLVGCDGLPYTEYFDTPLSTIALPMNQVCEIATQFLQSRIADPGIPVQRAVVQGELIVRKSLMAEI